MDDIISDEEMDSTDDNRTTNNAARHQYRVLTEEEKLAVAEIKENGQTLIDAIDAYATAIAPLFQSIVTHSPGSRAGEIALVRMIERLGIEVRNVDGDSDTGQLIMNGPDDLKIAAEEAIMWAVKSITA